MATTTPAAAPPAGPPPTVTREPAVIVEPASAAAQAAMKGIVVSGPVTIRFRDNLEKRGSEDLVTIEIADRARKPVPTTLLAQARTGTPALAREEPLGAMSAEWAAAGFSPQLAAAAVAHLGSGWTQRYDMLTSDVQRIAFVQSSVLNALGSSALFPWDANPKVRHDLVAQALPSQLSAYEHLGTEAEQLKFCIDKLGASGVINTEAYREAVRAAAMQLLGKRPGSTLAFLEAMGAHWNSINGFKFTSQAEARAQSLTGFALLQVPVPIFLEPAIIRIVTKLLDAAMERHHAKASQQSAQDLVRAFAGNNPKEKNRLLNLFNEVLSGDQLGDQQLRQAGLLLDAAQKLLKYTAWPTAASEVYVLLDGPTGRRGVTDLLDPDNSSNWEGWDAKKRTEEIAHCMQLISDRAQNALTDPQDLPALVQQTGLVKRHLAGPALIYRYFDVPENLDSVSREKLMRAAVISDAAWIIFFVTSDPAI